MRRAFLNGNREKPQSKINRLYTSNHMVHGCQRLHHCHSVRIRGASLLSFLFRQNVRFIFRGYFSAPASLCHLSVSFFVVCILWGARIFKGTDIDDEEGVCTMRHETTQTEEENKAKQHWVLLSTLCSVQYCIGRKNAYLGKKVWQFSYFRYFGY